MQDIVWLPRLWLIVSFTILSRNVWDNYFSAWQFLPTFHLFAIVVKN
uniref:Uncharacterized protein n=1 Tax=Rhizophora mucronata TaxID=61149 RepID=A0A2P2QLY6_RHIMU